MAEYLTEVRILWLETKPQKKFSCDFYGQGVNFTIYQEYKFPLN